MATYKELFTPIFIIVLLAVFIGGIMFLQLIDRLFNGSKNLHLVRIFFISILLNVIILIFLVMSFARIKLQIGPQGPTGNKGPKGFSGNNVGLVPCDKKYQSIQEKINILKTKDYLELKPPLLKND